jgi:ATP-dependent RNA helicase DeaD
MTRTKHGFDDFNLLPALVQAVDGLGFEEPTAIQRDAIPPLLAGRDLIGGARTGSGKTAAYGLPLMQRVHGAGPVRGLVLVPTRELALQITDALSTFAEHLEVEILAIYGGTSYRRQLRGLKRGATVVVGTPGRVIDLVERGALDLGSVEFFVLDEADEMAQMGFIDDVERVLHEIPPTRQFALFSATLTANVREIAAAHLRDFVEIQVEDSALSVDHIEQRFVRVTHRDKNRALLRLLAGPASTGTLVFARTRARSSETAAMLVENGIAADALHGDLSQSARERVLGRLRAKVLDVVVATDVAARGLDVDHLTHVINFDMPQNAERYVHRIGRTARAGRQGTAITFVLPREKRQQAELERDLGLELVEMALPSDEEIEKSRRDQLVDRLRQQFDAPEMPEMRKWLRRLGGNHGWSASDIASAAILALRAELDAGYTGVEVSSAGEPEFYEDINEREIVISLGRKDGIRPADIVGHFTNDLNIPADEIGLIKLGARRAFVGLPRAVAAKLVRDHPTVSLRGMTAEVHANDSPPPIDDR